MTLKAIKCSLEAFSPVSKQKQEVKAVLDMLLRAEPQLSDEECIDGLRQDLGVELLYSGEIISGPTTLFRLIRD